MDSEHWISRMAAAKRFYAAQLSHGGTAITTLLVIYLVVLFNYMLLCLVLDIWDGFLSVWWVQIGWGWRN
jgi:hypothetical protein